MTAVDSFDSVKKMQTLLISAAFLIGNPSVPKGNSLLVGYSVTAVTVTYAGGTWPSDSASIGPTGSWSYTTNGGSYPYNGYADAEYHAQNDLNLNPGTTFLTSAKNLDRTQITVQFKVEYSGGGSPTTGGPTFDRRYSLFDEVDISQTGDDWDLLSKTWDPNPNSILASPNVYYNSTNGWLKPGTSSSLFTGSWTNDAPGHYYKWFSVPIGATDEESISTRDNGTAGGTYGANNIRLGTTVYGTWQFRIISLGSGATKVTLQPNFP